MPTSFIPGCSCTRNVSSHGRPLSGFFCSCNLRVPGFLHMDQRSVGMGNENPDLFGGSSPVSIAEFLFCVRGKGGFPSDSDGKESTCNEGDLGSIAGLGRSSGGGHDNPLQYSYLEKSPWTEEPGGLQAMGLQRVRHDWVTMHIYTQGQRREGPAIFGNLQFAGGWFTGNSFCQGQLLSWWTSHLKTGWHIPMDPLYLLRISKAGNC